ncbi:MULTISPECIES: hypothetical protein [unclassified Spirosoma]|uniref:hypothetical protein n=1 Tax=unclassified Spirosoma TaxID=2621999 RepID=UPI001AD062E8|nr:MULTISPECIES: hypothetical protein [unclassified Spirosoma]MBN8826469.1 hypothetical protein [Spirosoma sp.]
MIASLAVSFAGDYKTSIYLSKYTANLTPEKAINAPGVQLSVIRRHNESSFYKTISLLLDRAKILLNATNTLTPIQISDCAARIAKHYYYLKIDEILLVIQRAVDGYYGKDYNRIDGGVVMEWIRRYDVEERTPLVVASSTEPVEIEKKEKLTAEGLDDFYKKASTTKNPMPKPEPKRVSDDRQKQAEARARYLAEKRAGIVQDYSQPQNAE